jgi:hypothetical protein
LASAKGRSFAGNSLRWFRQPCSNLNFHCIILAAAHSPGRLSSLRGAAIMERIRATSRFGRPFLLPTRIVSEQEPSK